MLIKKGFPFYLAVFCEFGFKKIYFLGHISTFSYFEAKRAKTAPKIKNLKVDGNEKLGGSGRGQ
jgi:hypothetical protein